MYFILIQKKYAVQHIYFCLLLDIGNSLQKITVKNLTYINTCFLTSF